MLLGRGAPMHHAGGSYSPAFPCHRDSYWVIEGLLLCNMTATARGMIRNFFHLVDK